MRNKNSLNFILCFACVLAAFAPVFSQTNDSFDIPKLLSEVKRESDENWRKVIAEFPNYSYKWHRVWRKADKQGRIKETSELYELFFPLKCAIKKCRTATVLLAENGKPVASEKIERQRAKAGEKLERMESAAQAQELPLKRDYRLHWMRFAYYVLPPFTSEPKVIVLIDGQEILEKCEFFAPARESVNGRETISLNFRPRADAVFGEETKYMPQAEPLIRGADRLRKGRNEIYAASRG